MDGNAMTTSGVTMHSRSRRAITALASTVLSVLPMLVGGSALSAQVEADSALAIAARSWSPRRRARRSYERRSKRSSDASFAGSLGSVPVAMLARSRMRQLEATVWRKRIIDKMCLLVGLV